MSKKKKVEKISEDDEYEETGHRDDKDGYDGRMEEKKKGWSEKEGGRRKE